MSARFVRSRRPSTIFLGLMTLLITASAPLFAAVPATMTYQARLTEPDGTPLADSLVNMRFRIYSGSSCPGGDALLWEEHHDNSTQQVQTDGFGMFEVLLGQYVPVSSALFPTDGAPRYLEVAVNGEVLCPRKVLNSLPYAFAATPSGELWQTDGTNVFRKTGNVGIGVATPSERLVVNGNIITSAHNDTVFTNFVSAKGTGDPAAGLGLLTNGSTRLHVNPSGNVGIGTDQPNIVGGLDPNSKVLTIHGPPGGLASAAVELSGDGANAPAFGLVRFLNAGGENARISAEAPDRVNGQGVLNFYTRDYSGPDLLPLTRTLTLRRGNVGIGTTGNPTEKLQVDGTVHSTTGGFKFPDGSVQTTAAMTGVQIRFGKANTGGSGRVTICGMPFSSSSSYSVVATRSNCSGYASQAITVCVQSGSCFEILDFTVNTEVNWIAIGN